MSSTSSHSHPAGFPSETEETSFKQLPSHAPELKAAMIDATNSFFKRHGIRLMKYVFPLRLPGNVKDLEELASQGKEQFPFTSIYRHMCNLKERILSNWSYIETPSNSSGDTRNCNMPFNLRPLSSQIIEQLDLLTKDLNDPEFSGVLITLHTARFTQVGLPERQCLSKVVGGALIEGLVTNDRCIKAIWMHPQLSPKSTHVILQAFLPRVILEAFNIEVEASADAAPFKFVYAMHDDLDRWPRQSWLLMASSKKMGLTRHYEPSTSPEYLTDLLFDLHEDSGVKHNLKSCQCKVEKLKKSAKDQGWLERLIGCTEQLMYSLIPKRLERSRFGLPNSSRLGWRDIVPDEFFQSVLDNVESLTPAGNAKQNTPAKTIIYNYAEDEWSGLNKDDLIDISSDSEIHLKKEGTYHKTGKKNKKVKVEITAKTSKS
ncbi:hypothetical protein IE077_000298 [Cardiosporidium cionae]|uniref:Uncharacterized protein n=1 Tax=Cardiosporidium cionae TaxID=476202 RepID=A0ABQ7J4N7_9APIC|nr:hypothetical protein IE077_000298 [Cardiosporidium cionae]|eukprot:KAF8818368.1 hypothetical protein IE077_000298 [Cardiosporidium cionae]